MKKLISIFISMFVVMMLIGCAGMAVKPSVCDTVPEGSYSVICDISHYLNVRPEDVSGVLKVGNLGGLALDAYTAQEAKDFINDIRIYLKRAQSGHGLLYATLLEFGEEKYNILPAAVQASIVLIEQFATVDLSMIPGSGRVLSDYDFAMLLKHLDGQDMIIAPFLGVMAIQ